jgi:hypothetical protein
MKVVLEFREQKHVCYRARDEKPPIPIRQSWPYCRSQRRGRRAHVHRVRHLSIIRYLPPDRLFADAWCGQGLQRPKLLEAVPDDRALCITCEVNATNAGEPATSVLMGRNPEFYTSPRATTDMIHLNGAVRLNASTDSSESDSRDD